MFGNMQGSNTNFLSGNNQPKSLFGANTGGGNLFGGNSGGNPGATGIFGGQSNQGGNTGTNSLSGIFGGSASNFNQAPAAAQNQSSTNVFAFPGANNTAPNNSNFFGNSLQGSSNFSFGGGNNTSTNVFGGANNTTSGNNSNFSLFSNAGGNNNANANTGGLFGGNNNTTSNLFANLGASNDANKTGQLFPKAGSSNLSFNLLNNTGGANTANNSFFNSQPANNTSSMFGGNANATNSTAFNFNNTANNNSFSGGFNQAQTNFGTMNLQYTTTQILEQNNNTNKQEKVNLMSITALGNFNQMPKSNNELRYEDYINRKKGVTPQASTASFPGTTNSLFGGSGNTGGNLGSGMFGGSSNTGASSGLNIFGGNNANNKTGTNFSFGGNTGGGSSNLFGNLGGGGNATSNVNNSSLFGGTGASSNNTLTLTKQPAFFGDQKPATTGTGNLFGNTGGATGSLFGGGSTTTGATNTSSIFGGSTAAGNTGGSLFGGATNTSGSNLFGSTNTTSGSSLFGAGGNKPSLNISTGGGSLFGGGAAPPSGNGNLFGSTTGTLFGKPSDTVGSGGSSLFGGGATTTTGSSLFSNLGNSGTSLFGSTTTTNPTIAAPAPSGLVGLSQPQLELLYKAMEAKNFLGIPNNELGKYQPGTNEIGKTKSLEDTLKKLEKELFEPIQKPVKESYDYYTPYARAEINYSLSNFNVYTPNASHYYQGNDYQKYTEMGQTSQSYGSYGHNKHRFADSEKEYYERLLDYKPKAVHKERESERNFKLYDDSSTSKNGNNKKKNYPTEIAQKDVFSEGNFKFVLDLNSEEADTKTKNEGFGLDVTLDIVNLTVKVESPISLEFMTLIHVNNKVKMLKQEICDKIKKEDKSKQLKKLTPNSFILMKRYSIIKETLSIKEANIEDKDTIYVLIKENLNEDKHLVKHGSSLTSKKEKMRKSYERDESVGNVINRELAPVERIPILTKPGYKTYPDYKVICRMSLEELQSIHDFTIYNEFGSIKFPGKTNLDSLNLDEIVNIQDKLIAVYQEMNVDKPEVGEGLNKEAIISLSNIRFSSGHRRGDNDDEDELYERFIDILRNECLKKDSTFISHNKITGEWVFKVDHF